MSGRFKGVSSIISVALVTGFIIISVAAVFIWASPLVEKSSRIAELERMKTVMSDIDDSIRLVAHSGEGSSRRVLVSVSKGRMEISENGIIYLIDVGDEVVKDGVVLRERNVWITGIGGAVELKLNYSNLVLDAENIITSDRTLVITKKEPFEGRPVVEVRVL